MWSDESLPMSGSQLKERTDHQDASPSLNAGLNKWDTGLLHQLLKTSGGTGESCGQTLPRGSGGHLEDRCRMAGLDWNERLVCTTQKLIRWTGAKELREEDGAAVSMTAAVLLAGFQLSASAVYVWFILWGVYFLCVYGVSSHSQKTYSSGSWETESL